MKKKYQSIYQLLLKNQSQQNFLLKKKPLPLNQLQMNQRIYLKKKRLQLKNLFRMKTLMKMNFRLSWLRQKSFLMKRQIEPKRPRSLLQMKKQHLNSQNQKHYLMEKTFELMLNYLSQKTKKDYYYHFLLKNSNSLHYLNLMKIFVRRMKKQDLMYYFQMNYFGLKKLKLMFYYYLRKKNCQWMIYLHYLNFYYFELFCILYDLNLIHIHLHIYHIYLIQDIFHNDILNSIYHYLLVLFLIVLLMILEIFEKSVFL